LCVRGVPIHVISAHSQTSGASRSSAFAFHMTCWHIPALLTLFYAFHQRLILEHIGRYNLWGKNCCMDLALRHIKHMPPGKCSTSTGCFILQQYGTYAGTSKLIQSLDDNRRESQLGASAEARWSGCRSSVAAGEARQVQHL
jgi:hypothetical protein